MGRFQQRFAREEGFTLIELLVVIVIIGILLAIAVPSYLNFKDKANEKTAAANVRAVIPSAESYYSDQVPNSYTGMTEVNLRATYDQGLAATVKATGSGTAYCISAVQGDYVAKVTGPGQQISSLKTNTEC